MRMTDWTQLGFEFAGVVVGVIFGFQLDRFRDWLTRNGERDEFLRMIREEINENLDMLKTAFPKFKDEFGYMPTQGLRVDTWHALSNRIALVKSASLRRQILTIYAKFDMYERTLSHYLELGYTSLTQPEGSGIKDAAEDEMKLLAGTICAQLNGPPQPGILGYANSVIVSIDGELRDC